MRAQEVLSDQKNTFRFKLMKPFTPEVTQAVELIPGMTREKVHYLRYQNNAPRPGYCFALWYWAREEAKRQQRKGQRARRAADSKRYRERQKAKGVIMWGDHERTRQREWYARNADKERQRAKEKKARRLATPEGKIEKAVRARLYDAVRKDQAPRKRPLSKTVAGCTLAELRTHLERQFKPNLSKGDRVDWHGIFDGIAA